MTDTSNTSIYLIPVETNPGWFQNAIVSETDKSYTRYNTTQSWAVTDNGGWAIGDIGIRMRCGPLTDPTADFSSATYTAGEGEGTVTITVELDHAPASSCSVNYATSDGTATQPSDYTTSSGTLTFTSSDTSKTFDVTLIDDSDDDPAETFTVTLSSPTNCTLAGTNNPATVTITDNDSPVADFSSFSYSVGEGDGLVAITVNLNKAPSSSCSVNYATSDGTATQPGDYTSTSGTLPFSSSGHLEDL